MPVYLDDRGEPIAAQPSSGPVYLDDNGEPIKSEAPREVINYRGLRISNTGETNPPLTDAEKADQSRQLAMLGGAATALGAGMAAPGAAALALSTATSPLGAAAIGGALDYAQTHSVPSAAAAALRDGLLGKIGGVVARPIAAAGTSLLARLAARAAPAAAEAAPAVAETAYRGIPSLMKVGAPVAEDAAAAAQAAQATKQAGNLGNLLRGARAAAPAAEEAAPAVAKVAAPGAAEVAKAAPAKTVVQFAKEIAKSDPKVGEKIWILLDDAGMPLKRLTSDEAGAAARKGLQTTWVKNLW